ncbi:MAG TPA: hypothetical protein VM093_02150 [Aeromicrobium sp.]|nr:hypothetical protein [Aeromicrobium sp.]
MADFGAQPQAAPPLPLPKPPQLFSSRMGEKSVRWLSLGQLAQTGKEVLLGTVFAKFADKREALASAPGVFYDLGSTKTEAWLDFLADTGDGFDATLAMARCVARDPQVVLTDTADLGEDPELLSRAERADLLVLGGDEVYPVASMANYLSRLLLPLKEASKGFDAPSPSVAALPGNHDWYDGLVSFRRTFCESWAREATAADPGFTKKGLPADNNRDDVGGWKAFQSRSYFAVQLTKDWWLWGLDSQLNAPVDAEQLQYFTSAAVALGTSNLILCTATPAWLEGGGKEAFRPSTESPLFTILWFLERTLDKRYEQLKLVLTGDQHHYARYRSTDGLGPDLVTAGGGGAFMSSTHHLPEKLSFDWKVGKGSRWANYRRESCFPELSESRKLLWARIWRVGYRNGWSLPAAILALQLLAFWPVAKNPAPCSAITTPLGIAAWGIVLAALTGFGRVGSKARRWPCVGALVLGVGHAAAQIGATIGIANLLHQGYAYGTGPEHELVVWRAAVPMLLVAGCLVLSLYLAVADGCGCHELEAISGLRIEDYKNYLRLHLTDHRASVLVIGVRKVPRARWNESNRTAGFRTEVIDWFDVPVTKAEAPSN